MGHWRNFERRMLQIVYTCGKGQGGKDKSGNMHHTDESSWRKRYCYHRMESESIQNKSKFQIPNSQNCHLFISLTLYPSIYKYNADDY